jgi:hypothetical protein
VFEKPARDWSEALAMVVREVVIAIGTVAAQRPSSIRLQGSHDCGGRCVSLGQAACGRPAR